MKKTVILSVTLALLMALLPLFASCGNDGNELWENAIHTKDKELGEGKTTVTVEVKAGEKSVSFTIHTDKTILGDILLEHELISGDEGPYGLYVKNVNGITADYDVDQTYWAFYKSGEYMMTGVDATEIEDGAHYELVREK